RIEAEAFEQEGQHGARERSEADDPNESGANRQCDELMMRPVVEESQRLPQLDPDATDQPENRAECETRWKFANSNLPPIAEADLAERERPNDERCRLRARVTARAHDERNEHREHDGLRDLSLE